MNEKILDALTKLDPANADHWTTDGAPRLDVLKLEGVKRVDVVKAAPHFNRQNPKLTTPAEDKVAAREQAVATARELAEAKREDAKVEAERTEMLLRAAQAEHQKSLAALDIAEREWTAIVGVRGVQADIMDYLAAVNARRFAPKEKV